MSEQHRTPLVEAEVGNQTLVFHYYNTVLHLFENCFDEPELNFSHMNNAIHKTKDGETYKIYDSPELIEQLAELAFRRVVKPYPDEEDIEQYGAYFMADLSGEVDRNGEA